MDLSRSSSTVWILTVVMIIVVTLGLVYVFSQDKTTNNIPVSSSAQQGDNIGANECTSDQCLAVDDLEYPVGKLPVDVLEAVNSALDDEYKAYSVYDAVIKKTGSVRPFSMIIRAEESHIASLKSILDKYGEPIPTNSYEGKISVKETTKENCQIGVDAEIANIALYRDDLLSKVTDYTDITSVFNSLMSASEDKHLPAFEKCN